MGANHNIDFTLSQILNGFYNADLDWTKTR